MDYKKVNNTLILGLSGELIGSNVIEFSNHMLNFIEKDLDRIILDFKNVIAMDDLAIIEVEKLLNNYREIYIFNLRFSIQDYLSKRGHLRQWPICSYQEISRMIDKGVDVPLREKRCFTRVYPCTPLEIKLDCKEFGYLYFRGVAINLSCDGLYVEYLDCDQIIDIEKCDFVGTNVDEIRVLSSEQVSLIKLKGLVVHRQIRNGQIGLGIKFKKGNKRNKERLKRYILDVIHKTKNNEEFI